MAGLFGTIGNFLTKAHSFGDPTETFRRNTPAGLLDDFSEEEQRRLGEQMQSQFRMPGSRAEVRERHAGNVESLLGERQVEQYNEFVQTHPNLSDENRRLLLQAGPEQGMDMMTGRKSHSPGTTYTDELGRPIFEQPTTDQQDLAAAGVAPDSPDGQAKLADTPGRNVLESFTVADVENPDRRRTVVRTPSGIFEQSVDGEGNPVLTPIDTTKVRRISTAEQGSREDLGTVDQRTMDDAQLATIGLTRTANDALKLLDDSKSINTFVAGTSGLINSLQQEGRALASALGKDFDEEQLNPERFESTFSDLGVDNARLKSLFTSLAFQAAAATGQTGRSVSDKDIERFIQQTGKSSADPDTMKAVLTDLVERTRRGFRDRYRVKTGRAFEGSLPSIYGTEQPSANTSGLPENIPEGSTPAGTLDGKPVFKTPDGRIVTVE